MVIMFVVSLPPTSSSSSQIISTSPEGHWQRDKRTRTRRRGVLLSFEIDAGVHDMRYSGNRQKSKGEKLGVSGGKAQRR
jgi:hypothetical protein